MNYWRQPLGDRAGPVDWIAVAIFFVVSCVWSGLAAHWPALALPARVGGMRIDAAMLVGFGPAFGALAASLLRPRPRPARSLLGTSPAWSAVALAAPVAALGLWSAMAGAPGWLPAEGLVFAVSITIYCVGEELGWRGWLHDALGGMAMWRAALVTAALWYAWHWTFFAEQLSNPMFGLIFAAGIVVFSFLFAAAVRRTRSKSIAIAWHAASKVLIAPVQFVPMLAVIALANWLGGRGRRRPL